MSSQPTNDQRLALLAHVATALAQTLNAFMPDGLRFVLIVDDPESIDGSGAGAALATSVPAAEVANVLAAALQRLPGTGSG